MRSSVPVSPTSPVKLTNLRCAANILIQNVGGSQFAVVSATNGSPNIAWVSDTQFNTKWAAGTLIKIGGATYAIQSVTSAAALVLTENFTGQTNGLLPMFLLSNIYISDSLSELQTPVVNGVPQAGLIIEVGGSLTLQNWSTDLYALADSNAVSVEVVVNEYGGASINNPAGARSSVNAPNSSSGGTLSGGGGGIGGGTGPGGKGGFF
jgi:hypothetical protein